MTKRYAPGNLTSLSITPSGGSITAIAQIIKITPPGGSREEIDVTDLLSTAAERLLSIPDWNGLKFTLNYDADNAGHAAVLTNFNADPITGMKATWTITLNDIKLTTATTISFSGQCSEHTYGEIENKAVATVDVTVSVTGAVTITPAA